jgi:hypothetical protein
MAGARYSRRTHDFQLVTYHVSGDRIVCRSPAMVVRHCSLALLHNACVGTRFRCRLDVEAKASGFMTVVHLTNRWSQPLAVTKSTFDFMKQFPVFATLPSASGGSAPSR